MHTMFKNKIKCFFSIQFLWILFRRLNLIAVRFKTKVNDFCWVPSHVDILGNERADRAVHFAVNCKKSGWDIRFLLSTQTDLISNLQACWVEECRSNLHGIKFLLKKWMTSSIVKVILLCLRISHANIYSYLIGKEHYHAQSFLSFTTCKSTCMNFMHI